MGTGWKEAEALRLTRSAMVALNRLSMVPPKTWSKLRNPNWNSALRFAATTFPSPDKASTPSFRVYRNSGRLWKRMM